MLRSFARITALLASLALAAPALAAPAAPAPAPAGDEKAKLGVGISLTAFDFVAAQVTSPVPPSADVLINFDLGQFRLEPSLGINSYAIDGGPKGRIFNLGCGLLIPLKAAKTAPVSA